MGQAGDRATGAGGSEVRSTVEGTGDVVAIGRHRSTHVRRASPSTLSKAKQQRFLDVLAATANVQRAAAAVGCAPSSVYRLRYRDGSFAAAWREALDSAMVRLESAVLAHALGEGGEMTGDAERAGDAGRIDIALAMQLLTRRPTSGSRGMTQRRRLPIEEVERVLLQRLDAMARRKQA